MRAIALTYKLWSEHTSVCSLGDRPRSRGMNTTYGHENKSGGRVLRDPGIEHRRSLAIEGLPERFWGERRALMPLYPCGIDILLVSGDRIAGLPRTTVIEE